MAFELGEKAGPYDDASHRHTEQIDDESSDAQDVELPFDQVENLSSKQVDERHNHGQPRDCPDEDQ